MGQWLRCLVGALKDIRRSLDRAIESFEAVDVARRCAAAITKRASAASSAKASMAGGDTCSGKAFVSQPPPPLSPRGETVQLKPL